MARTPPYGRSPQFCDITLNPAPRFIDSNLPTTIWLHVHHKFKNRSSVIRQIKFKYVMSGTRRFYYDIVAHFWHQTAGLHPKTIHDYDAL